MNMAKVSKTDCWIFLMRLVMGWVFLYAGLQKILQGNWTAEKFLTSLNGPFASFFHQMAGNHFIDWLNMIGLILIGTALVLGIFVRWTSFWAIILMVLYYLAQFPPRQDYLVLFDEHIVYIFIFVGFMIFGSGKFWAIDNLLEKSKLYKNNPWLHWILG